MRSTVARRRVRFVLVPVLLVGLLVVPVVPARAFLSSLDPAGWAVVAQMAAVVSQGIAIKRQVENVRNQARAHFFGKIAPLTGKLGRVRDLMRGNRYTGTVVLVPQWGIDRLDPLDVPIFNQTFPPCSIAVPGEPCLADEATVDPALLTAASQPLLDGLATTRPRSLLAVYSASLPVQRESAARLQALIDQRLLEQQAAVDFTTERRNERRAILDSAMQAVEDWRGCQPAPYAPTIGDALDTAVDDRFPCVTNEGLGRGDGTGGDEGTRGIAEDLVSKITALEALQEGDASQVQIDTIQTQVLVQLARLSAARTAVDARTIEQRERARLEREAARRRRIALYERHLDCVEANGPYSTFVPDPAQPGSIPPVGECLVVDDVSDQIADALVASSLWNP